MQRGKKPGKCSNPSNVPDDDSIEDMKDLTVNNVDITRMSKEYITLQHKSDEKKNQQRIEMLDFFKDENCMRKISHVGSLYSIFAFVPIKNLHFGKIEIRAMHSNHFDKNEDEGFINDCKRLIMSLQMSV